MTDRVAYGLSLELKKGGWVKLGVETDVREGESLADATQRAQGLTDALLLKHVNDLNLILE